MIRTSAGEDAVCAGEGTLVLKTSYGNLPISLTAMPPRRIAALKLPVTRVEFDYTGWDKDAQENQQQWLDLHLRRGGG